ncbi:hypothetical protein JOF56_007660 [Kibdelosporangium banguiense]|uniref:Right handed beta helix domain-containing protein n=1 Tax=Kibdelosporangium banguiense TaxID=1365924 RepID=A0ABS4TTH1_9PSEU|nr:right-handed parallel beta-helix repeat-containing protein [Kibdelosporangium banguiense]MBP2327275.1 hypothetical protein [Kibdelosporangium banguiense]
MTETRSHEFQAGAAPGGKIYYVDSVAGDDASSGRTTQRPWRSLERLNQVTFQAGDMIRFRRGREFAGMFTPRGSGSPGRPITIDAYGTGPKPVIDGGGATAAIMLSNVEGWQVRDLDVRNEGPPPVPGEQRAGIYVLLEDFGVGRHYVISNVDVHDVNGPDSRSPIPSGGIVFVAGGTARPTGFDGVTVENNTVEHADRLGIALMSHWTRRDRYPDGTGSAYVPSKNVVIRRNRVKDVGGDGIMIYNGVRALVEHNVVDGFAGRSAEFNSGVYGFNSDNSLFRHNEICNGQRNGMALDIETADNGTVYEYNFSHHNNGGFLLTCNDAGAIANNNVIRYNISHDDRDGDGSVPLGVITVACGIATNLRIHNNTIYAPNAARVINNLGETAAEVSSNIFIGRSAGSTITDPHGTYSGNVYHNVTLRRAVDANAVEADPLLAIQDGQTDADVHWFQLREGSAALKGGDPTLEHNGRDYFGNAVSGTSPNIGAYQGPGVTP